MKRRAGFGNQRLAFPWAVPNNDGAGTIDKVGAEPAIPFYPLMFKNLRLLWVFVYEMPQEAMLEAGRDFNAWLASGAAVHPRYHSFPPERHAGAHLAVEEGAIGKVIVELGG